MRAALREALKSIVTAHLSAQELHRRFINDADLILGRRNANLPKGSSATAMYGAFQRENGRITMQPDLSRHQ
jgi:hypothetical protein